MTTTADNAKSGIVYILTNESMPGYLKIGYTQGSSEVDVTKRMSELHTTGVPLPFECVYAAVVADAQKIEKQLHTVFEKDRTSPRREFFECKVRSAKAALEIAGGRDVTPGKPPEDDADGELVVVRPPKRPPLKFSMVDIDPGTELAFLRNESVTCTVADDQLVQYKDKTTALSPLTRDLLGYATTPAGGDYWLYDGETLNERRRRLENEEADSN